MVLAEGSAFISKLLHEYHDSAIGEHNGEHKTFLRIAADWFWIGMRKQIIQYVRSCHICQRHKSSHLQPAGLLEPLPIPDKVWADISMDFVEALPKSKGYDTIFVVVDCLTKYAHFVRLKHPFTAQSVAGVFVREIVRLHGFPNSIVSNRGKIFLSIFWKELFRLKDPTTTKYNF